MPEIASRLKVVAMWPGGKRGTMCRAICTCGTLKDYPLSDLNRKDKATVSCGCYRNEIRGQSTIIHGKSHTPVFRSWASMIQRCTNPNNDFWHNYGGRGIKVCDSWKVFTNFLADMGERPEGTSLDRFPDNDGNYEPGNCRWATRTQQQRNRTRRKPESSSAKAEEES